jgi:hypothetical protein
VTRQLVGAMFLAIAAALYGVRHLGAAIISANKTGNLSEQYRLAFDAVGGELSVLAIIAALVGVAYLAWGEYEQRRARG